MNTTFNYLEIVHQCPDCGKDLERRPTVFKTRSSGHVEVFVDGEEPDKCLRCVTCMKNWSLGEVWTSSGWFYHWEDNVKAAKREHNPDYDFGDHEVTDRAAMILNAASENLLEHPKVQADAQLRELAKTAVNALMDLYQAAGAKMVRLPQRETEK